MTVLGKCQRISTRLAANVRCVWSNSEGLQTGRYSLQKGTERLFLPPSKVDSALPAALGWGPGEVLPEDTGSQAPAGLWSRTHNTDRWAARQKAMGFITGLGRSPQELRWRGAAEASSDSPEPGVRGGERCQAAPTPAGVPRSSRSRVQGVPKVL